MNLTRLMRSACRMSALVALAGTVPVAAMAAPEAAKAAPVAAKAASEAAKVAPVAAKTAPEAAKVAPVAAKTAPVKAKAASVTAKAAPAAAKASRATARASRVAANAYPEAAMATPSVYLVPVGESRVYRLERPIKRVAVGNPDVADYIMLNSTELYLLGKKQGATNLILWDQKGNSTSTPLQVGSNINSLKALLRVVLPKETDIQIYTWGQALVLAGSVSDALAADTVFRIVKVYMGGTVPGVNPETTLLNSVSAPGSAAPSSMLGVGSGSSGSGSTARAGMPGAGSGASGSASSAGIPGVVNLLKIRDPQQVRLEVHIAEVSKSYIESLGIGWSRTIGNTQGTLTTGFVSSATLDLLMKAAYDPVRQIMLGNQVQVEAERKSRWIKILAEPTIVAMSGQEGYFLVGGKVYTPTVTANGAIDYVERTYGVGLRFTPTVLDAARISLKVTPEVSEPNQEAITAGTTSNLPAFKISTVSTTVQMNEGENLVIGGLLRDNLTEVIRAVPLLGEIPLLGALFRRTEKNSETTELMVIVRPTLVKASTSVPELPTDRFVPPTRKELFIDGKLQGSRAK